MRLIATAVACVLAAFGAAFLIGRAANHQGSATAATTPSHVTVTSTSTSSTATTTKRPDNKALAAQFQPGLGGLRHKPRPRPKPAAPAPSAAPVTTTQSYTPPATTYTAPAYSPPAQTTPKRTPTHKGGGTGTTTIG